MVLHFNDYANQPAAGSAAVAVPLEGGVTGTYTPEVGDLIATVGDDQLTVSANGYLNADQAQGYQDLEYLRKQFATDVTNDLVYRLQSGDGPAA